jgi:hypothetical protein
MKNKNYGSYMIFYRAYIATILHFYIYIITLLDPSPTRSYILHIWFCYISHLYITAFHMFIAVLFYILHFLIFLFYHSITFPFFILPFDDIPFPIQFSRQKPKKQRNFIFTWRLTVVRAASDLSCFPVTSRLLPASHPPHATYLQLVFNPLL